MAIRLDEARIRSLKITESSASPAIAFGREGWNYITAPKGSTFAFCPGSADAEGDCSGPATRLAISYDAVIPGQNNGTINLGSSTYKWNNIYANTVHGALIIPDMKGGAWADFKTDKAIYQKMYSVSTGFATPLIQVETPTNRTFIYGGHSNELQYGFYLYEKDATSAAWKTYWNLTTGELYHEKGIHATTFYGALSGNASTATALTSNAGSSVLPIYFSGGKPVAVSDINLIASDTTSKVIAVANSNGSVGILASINYGLYDFINSSWIIYRPTGTSSTYIPAWANIGSAYVPTYHGENGVPTTVSANSVIVNLASTAGASIFAASPRPGVTGTLPVANGGTGNTAMTANRLVWSESASKLEAGYHYANSTKVAINSTSAPSQNFYVNGSSKLDGTSYINNTNFYYFKWSQQQGRPIGWFRLCQLGTGVGGYCTCILQISGGYNNGAPTVGTFAISLMHQEPTITQLAGQQGTITKLRVTGNSGNYYLEVYQGWSYTGTQTQSAYHFNIYGNVAVYEIQDPTTTIAETPSGSYTASIDVKTIKNSMTFQIKDSDSTNAGTATAFNRDGNMVLTLPATIKASLTGNADTATTASALSAAWSADAVPLTDPGAGVLKYYYNVSNGLTGNMPTVNNANGILYLNTHSGEYGYQLGFSSDGNIYYRRKNGSAFTSSSAWATILTSSNYSSYALPKSGGTLSGSITISHATSATMDSTTTNPRIVFSENGSQSVGLVYTDYDNYRSPAGLKVLDMSGSNGNVWFEVTGEIIAGTKVTAPSFVGDLTGTAEKATQLATPRSISINSTAGTTGTNFDGSSNITIKIPLTVTAFAELGTNKISSGGVLYITPASTLYLDSAEQTSLIFRPQGIEKARFDKEGNFLIKTAMYPGTNSTYNLGTSDYKWKNVYATNYYGEVQTLAYGTAYPGGSTTNIWHEVATFTQKNTSQINTKLVLYVSNYYDTEKSGIIEITARQEISAAAPVWIKLNLITASGGMTPSDFVATWRYDSSTTTTTIKLYAKCSGWTSHNFSKIAEHAWGSSKTAWVLNKVSSTGITAIPSGETQITASLTKNSFQEVHLNNYNKTSSIYSQNASYLHYSTTADVGHWFNKTVYVSGDIYAGSSYDQKVLHASNYTDYALSKSGGTLTGKLQVNAPIFGYNYTNSNNAAAFIFDKPSSHHTGIGACGESNTIYFGACDIDGTWVTNYYQNWKFNGSLIVGGGSDNCNIVPWANNYSTIGTESLKWSKMYASTFYGNLSGNATSATNDDRGYNIYNTYEKRYTQTVDLTSYNTDTWYPVYVYIPRGGMRRVACVCQLDTESVPSWSTHSSGFTRILELLVTAGGWGTTNASTLCLQDFTNFSSGDSPVGYKQFTNSSYACFYCRGGGKYILQTDWVASWTIASSAITVSSATIEPVSSYPGVDFYKTRIYANVTGDSLVGAVWNDYAEYRESDCKEFGRVLAEKGDDALTKTTKRLQAFAGVSSDTWGFCQGETEKAKTPIAVAGRVLVYTYRNRNEYKPGDCVCAAPNGTVDIMTREEIIKYPDRIVGTVSCVPEYETWGSGDRDPVNVNRRIWIKVR